MFISATATIGAHTVLVKGANIIWLIIPVMGELAIVAFKASTIHEELANGPARHGRRAGSDPREQRGRSLRAGALSAVAARPRDA